ncbi:MAG: DUF1501 domain-containing protein [Janthinobacterium lividum]
MNRRRFVVSTLSVAALAAISPQLVRGAQARVDVSGAASASGRVPPPLSLAPRGLIVIDLMGGNDGLNTVVPIADPLYRKLRPGLALGTAQTVRLDDTRRLHAALLPLLPLWQSGEFAIIEGVGVQAGPLGHFRAAQVRRSGSRANIHQSGDWLERAMAVRTAAGSPVSAGRRFAAARPVAPSAVPSAAPSLPGRFNDAAQRAADAMIADEGIGALRLTLAGFDTHCRQSVRHAAALTELAGGIAILRHRLQQAGRWNDTLIMTTSEFGRAAAENGQGGTEHGGAAPQFLLGGRVQGGFHGIRPRLEAHGGAIAPGIDHRRVLASVLASWWGIAPSAVLDDAPTALPGLFRV